MSPPKMRKTLKRVPMAHVSQMVVDALRNLKRPNGCTADNIKEYIQQLHDENNDVILSKVPLALQRGVKFGAIKQQNANYKLDAIMVMATRNTRNIIVSKTVQAACKKPMKAKKRPNNKKQEKQKLEVADRYKICN